MIDNHCVINNPLNECCFDNLTLKSYLDCQVKTWSFGKTFKNRLVF